MAISVGDKLTGRVSGITKFGAFVDLGNHQTGLVHISEVSNDYVKDINDILKVKDEVTVLVTKIGDDGKMALSIKKANKEHSDTKKSNFKPKKQAPKNKKTEEENFDDLLSSFLKESESRLSTIKKNTEGKRGGRGGRRS
ncbi:RNA-binding protein S1 [Lactobacillus sp. S2-2]|uniref:S1 domain-containing RNA-binding protein n=1 Tax=Lactobacillus sp. S2-2 TaxID=2692917 RepID=UPI001F00C0B6|nr:S1 domain-containing RNA-binding protein [Lactobacillus sp. S2-2]MCF6515877.1 RNA-binding protein S1 [Lactobacillus sp. S2-2]